MSENRPRGKVREVDGAGLPAGELALGWRRGLSPSECRFVDVFVSCRGLMPEVVASMGGDFTERAGWRLYSVPRVKSGVVRLLLLHDLRWDKLGKLAMGVLTDIMLDGSAPLKEKNMASKTALETIGKYKLADLRDPRTADEEALQSAIDRHASSPTTADVLVEGEEIH